MRSDRSKRRRGEYRREVELVDGAGRRRRAVFEHPAAVRLAHWAIALAVPLLVMSGLQIFRAFPGFGPKIPQQDLLDVPMWAALGGWLGGAIRWHFAFAWVFVLAAAAYVVYQLGTGNWRQVVVSRRDLAGVPAMVRHYASFGRSPKPACDGAYNPLQKLAYTTTLASGALAAVSGFALLRPTQLGWLVSLFGGFQGVRIAHFVAMCGLLAFVPGHLFMVVLAGWNNIRSMWTGFKLEDGRGAADSSTD